MAKQLVSKADFARLMGCNPSTVTKLCRGSLSNALEGRRIDLSHPSVVAYMDRKANDNPHGIDPLYDECVLKCSEGGRWSVKFVREHVGVGYERAKRLVALMEANNAIKKAERAPPVSPHRDSNTAKKASSNPKKAVSAKSPPKPSSSSTGFNRPLKSDSIPTSETEVIDDVPEDLNEFLDWPMKDLVGKFGTAPEFLDWLKATKVIGEVVEKRLKNGILEGTLISRDLIKGGVLDHFENAHTRILSDGVKNIVKQISTLTLANAEIPEMEEKVSEILTSLIRPAKAKIERTLRR